MNAKQLYKDIISNRKAVACTWKEMRNDAIEHALTSMQRNGSRCEIGDGYHMFMFQDGSALKLSTSGIEIRG
jgi:hypothetical protein